MSKWSELQEAKKSTYLFAFFANRILKQLDISRMVFYQAWEEMA